MTAISTNLQFLNDNEYQHDMEAVVPVVAEKKISSLGITRAASFWYPTMLAQECGEISESKAAELLGIGIEECRFAKHNAVKAVVHLIENLPTPLLSLFEVIKKDPDFFN